MFNKQFFSIKKSYVFLIILCFVQCKNSDLDEFNHCIIAKYEKCAKNSDCKINLKELPFKWDKFYIISENHFPDLIKGKDISALIQTDYNGNLDSNERLLIFIYKGQVVHKITDNYKKEKLIDPKLLMIDFYIDNTIPDYFEPNNALFSIKKYQETYMLHWINQENNH